MKNALIPSSVLFASVAAMLLAGCIKMPKTGGAEPEGPEGPDNPDFPPPLRNTFIRSAMNPAR